MFLYGLKPVPFKLTHQGIGARPGDPIIFEVWNAFAANAMLCLGKRRLGTGVRLAAGR